MKKLVFIFCFFSCLSTVCAQTTSLDSLEALLTKTTGLRERYDILRNLSDVFSTNGNTENNVGNHLEMIRIAHQLKNDTLLAISYSVTGSYYLFNKGDYNTSLDYHFKSIEYSNRLNLKRPLCGTYCDISLSYSHLLNFPEALNFAKKAEANLPDKNFDAYYYLLSQVEDRYANYYINIRQPKLALQHAQAANNANMQLNNTRFEAGNFALFGSAYHLQGDNDLAEAYFKKSLAKSDSLQFPYEKYLAKNGYIGVLLNINNFAEAKRQAFDLLELGQQFQNNTYQLTATSYLKKIFDTENKVDSAYYYSKLESALKDTVFNQEKINKAQSMAFQNEMRTKEEQAKQLEAEQQRKQNIQYALLALGIITFIITFLLLSRRHITNTKLIQFLGVVALLVVFEFLNLLLHPFLERVTHHSPVLMLLALVCIAALLVPLHHKLEKWATHKLVEKNKAVRLAAAKKTIEELDKGND